MFMPVRRKMSKGDETLISFVKKVSELSAIPDAIADCSV